MSRGRFVDRYRQGAEVRFNRGFLARTSTPDYPLARGKITGVEAQGDLRYAAVAWDRPGIPGLVNVANLAVIRERERR